MPAIMPAIMPLVIDPARQRHICERIKLQVVYPLTQHGVVVCYVVGVRREKYVHMELI